MPQAACFPNQGCSFGATEEAFYYTLGQDGRDSKEGCTYSYDLWLNGKPFKKDIAAEVVDANGKKRGALVDRRDLPGAWAAGDGDGAEPELRRWGEGEGRGVL